MASSGGAAAALRHSFVTSVGRDRDTRPKTLKRTPSLPSQFADKQPQKANKKRTSGLFESSSESEDESSREQRSTSEKHVNFDPAVRPRASRHHDDLENPPARHPSLTANNSLSQERRGLFETEDDAADSVESLRERAKLRQQKKETEILNLRRELDEALTQVRVAQESSLVERKEKEEFAIRMNECQRIIEKRNKQLIKASEKLARLAEQSDAQINDLQIKINKLVLEAPTVRATEEAAREQLRLECEDKLVKQRRQYDTQLEKLTQASADKLAKKEADEIVLRKKIVQLENDVVTAATQITASVEYQTLLKRCEDAEAISRGLRFQLEKAQNEKRQLKKQVLTSHTPADSKNGSAPTDLFANLAGTQAGSPASSVASGGDLSNFDFFSSHPSPPISPTTTKPPPQEVPGSSSRKSSLKVTTETGPAPSHRDNKSSKANSSRESREPVYATSTDGNDADLSVHTPPTSQTDKVETKNRPGSGTINFFEKMTFKFKRSASSPRASAKTLDDPDISKAPSLFGSSAASSTPIDIPPVSGRRNVLPNRPKMYVAKSPSEHEESSDSIFGSDSESDASSSDEGRATNDDPPPPPPPPHSSGQRRISPPGSRSMDASAVPPPPPLPPLFGDVSDADSSSLSSEDEDKSPRGRRNSKLRRLVLPVPPPPSEAQPTNRESVSSSSASLSDDSDSSNSDSDSSDAEHDENDDEEDATVSKRDSKAAGGDSAPSSDSDAAPDQSKRRRNISNDIMGSARYPSNSRPEKRERSRSTEAAGDPSATAASKVNRMNEYMEARAKKRQEKLTKKQERESEEHKKRQEYEQEWERMAQEERERRRKQQQARRTGKRRPSSMKTVRVSQMRQQMGKHHQPGSKDQVNDGSRGKDEDHSDDGVEPPPPGRRRSERPGSDSDGSDDGQENDATAASPPLPPEPSAADTELYIRQQARLRERHEMEMKKRQDADEADQVRGQIHRRIELWAFGKELLHLILTLDQISTSEALRQCQLMVVQSPDPETLRKAYRNIIRVIHPDKLRNASIAEQLEAKELFTVLNQAFEKFKAQN